MTDRHAGYLVILARDIREDDSEAVMDALRMIKGVASVQPVPGDYALTIAEERRDAQWREALFLLATNVPRGSP